MLDKYTPRNDAGSSRHERQKTSAIPGEVRAGLYAAQQRQKSGQPSHREQIKAVQREVEERTGWRTLTPEILPESSTEVTSTSSKKRHYEFTETSPSNNKLKKVYHPNALTESDSLPLEDPSRVRNRANESLSKLSRKFIDMRRTASERYERDAQNFERAGSPRGTPLDNRTQRSFELMDNLDAVHAFITNKTEHYSESRIKKAMRGLSTHTEGEEKRLSKNIQMGVNAINSQEVKAFWQN